MRRASRPWGEVIEPVRIYDDAPRQHYEEVLRSLGAELDRREMREVLILEVAAGFEVHGLSLAVARREARGDAVGYPRDVWQVYTDEHVAALLEYGPKRRGAPGAAAGPYEQVLRVLGRYVDDQAGTALLVVEDDHHVLVRLRAGSAAPHVLAQFARTDLDRLIAEGPASRSVAKGRRLFGRR